MNILYFHCTLCLLVFTAAFFPFLFPWRFLALNLPHGLCSWLGYLFSLLQQIFCGLTLSKYKITKKFSFALKILQLPKQKCIKLKYFNEIMNKHV